ncbi:MAG: tRNA pseudouridine(55) synthase TruB, partial [Planctomycetota bacterium]
MLGLLNMAKPAGITSRDVVNRIQRLVRPAKIGHAGTLDPLATGVLVVAIGSATRLIEQVQAGPKSYRATFLLGRSSDSDDTEGEVTVHAAAP